MKNLNEIWNQLFSPFNTKRQRRESFRHRSSSTSCAQSVHSTFESNSHPFVVVRQHSEPPLSFHYNQHRRRPSTSSDSNSSLNSNGSSSNCQLNRSKSISIADSCQYQHPKYCECNICLLQNRLHRFHSQQLIEVIVEEEEEEEVEEKKEEIETNDLIKMSAKMDKIEPFQKPEHLSTLSWQQPCKLDEPDVIKRYPPQSNGTQFNDNVSKLSFPTVLMDRNSPSPPSSSYLDENGRCRSSASNFLRTHQLRSSCPPPSRPRRQRSKTPSNRSMIYPETSCQIPLQKSSNKLNRNERNHHSSTTGLVDKMQTKLNQVRKSWLFSLFQPNGNSSSANNSKDKSSKWKRSDDFEAEFFDRHRQLTESLITRQSPLMFGSSSLICPTTASTQSMKTESIHSNGDSLSIKTQMSLSSSKDEQITIGTCGYPTTTTSSLVTAGSNINKKTIDTSTTILASKERSQPLSSTSSTNLRNGPIGSQLSVGSSRHRPRPLSACLDTYMLRMRNGNFIEFTVDDENQDESCSIISSANIPDHQLIGDYSFPSQSISKESSIKSTLSPNTTVNSQTSSEVSSIYRQPLKQQARRRPASIVVSSDLSNISRFNSSSSSSNNQLDWHQSSSLVTTKTNSAVPLKDDRTKSNIEKMNTTSIVLGDSAATPVAQSSSNNSSSQSSLKLPPGHKALHVYWPVRRFTEVSIGPNTTAAELIDHFLSSQLYNQVPYTTTNPTDIHKRNLHSYALRLICRTLNPNDHQWLHPKQMVQQFFEQNRFLIEKGWIIELRIRYMPSDLQSLADQDRPTFTFLYEQILEEFLQLDLPHSFMLSNQDLIVELGCLELRHRRHWLTPSALDKNSNLEELENDLHNFLPATFIALVKTKQLRKLIKNKFKKIFAIQDKNAMLEFLRLIPQFINFRREVFRCSLGDTAWSVPIDLTISPEIGIAYFTAINSPPTILVKTFDLIEEIQIVSHSTMNRTNNNDTKKDSTLSRIPIKKILVNIRIQDEEDILVISCPSFAIAQSLADLIDGYHRLISDDPKSVWINAIADNPVSSKAEPIFQHNIKPSCVNHINANQISTHENNCSVVIEPRRAGIELITPRFASTQNTINPQHSKASLTSVEQLTGNRSITTTSTKVEETKDEDDDDADYSNPMEVCPEICRDNLDIGNLIGNGQFGDVYRGTYRVQNQSGSSVSIQEGSLQVAVKISRIQPNTPATNSNESRSIPSRTIDYLTADQKLISEASRMHQLDHANIIKLIGVCSASPVYVIMELAQFGELRDFLHKHGSTLEHRILIEYSMQISSAMAYLETMQFVHRDIAARNILVFSFECVKLADFGLSRVIDDASYYMATNSKLPIKWMAPESINFRRFTTASDVWMFAVCMWEIFMLGRKPFQGIKNADVIGLIEAGDRLPKPIRCPDPLYQLMLKCWRYEPDKRPTFRYIKRHIKETYQTELGLVGAIAHIETHCSSSLKSSHSSLSGGGDSSCGDGTKRTYHQRASSSASSSMSRQYNPIGNYQDKLEQKCNSNLSLNNTTSQGLDSEKIKEILMEQRRQMEEDSKWLQQNEFNWHKDLSNSLNSTKSSIEMNGSTGSTSVYEDADCSGIGSGKGYEQIRNHLQPLPQSSEQHLYSVPNLATKSNRISYGDESYNSFKSTTSFMGTSSTERNAFNDASTPSLSSLSDSNEDCGLSVSLKKFFKQNQLSNSVTQNEMMKQVNYSSAEMDRTDDSIYWDTINVINSVEQLMKGVRQVNTTEYVDLVKNVGQELRNLLGDVDQLLSQTQTDYHWPINAAQKKLTSDMNELVESMKKAIMQSDTPLEEAYKQQMLETAYVLVIDTKNLLDTIDNFRMDGKQQESSISESTIVDNQAHKSILQVDNNLNDNKTNLRINNEDDFRAEIIQ